MSFESHDPILFNDPWCSIENGFKFAGAAACGAACARLFMLANPLSGALFCAVHYLAQKYFLQMAEDRECENVWVAAAVYYIVPAVLAWGIASAAASAPVGIVAAGAFTATTLVASAVAGYAAERFLCSD